ncbi:hypothetical protein KAT59_01170, partial [Candidatus Bipolaricaulota bacterium]|nr:hypothetical protein [Candidatus Bipolaricaulota bacterium]
MVKIACVVMHAPLGESLGERIVEKGREASTEDLVTTLKKAGMERTFLLTQSAALAERFSDRGVSTVLTGNETPFHFGKALQRVIAEEALDGLLYFGSGAGGLLTVEQIARLVSFASRVEQGALFNNFYSCDFCAIARAERLLEVDLPEIDNALAFVLADHGIPSFSLPRTVETQFDIDTPTDLVLLAAAERGGDAMRTFLAAQSLNHSMLEDLLTVLTDRRAHLTLIGRMNPTTWTHFEGEVACRTSAYSEGRGMRAYPDGKAPLLASTLKEMGIDSFFERLERSTDAAIIDTRPLLALGGLLPPIADRFASDLL